MTVLVIQYEFVVFCCLIFENYYSSDGNPYDRRKKTHKIHPEKII